MNVRRLMPWVAALALAVLGWYAMVPLWTQGLSMVALDGDGQPGLWFAVAKASLVLGGSVLLLQVSAIFSEKPSPAPIGPWGRAFGLGLYLAAAVLFAAMAGQPLRSWFLAAYSDWPHPMVRAGLGLLVCLLAFWIDVRQGRFFSRATALAGFAAVLLTVSQLGGLNMFLALLGSVLLLAVTRYGKRLGYLVWGWAACCLAVVLLNLPLADGHVVIPTAQEWLVLAFALGCGLLAAWGASRRKANGVPAN